MGSRLISVCFIILMSMVLISSKYPANKCDCVPSPDLKSATKKAKAIFIGKALEVTIFNSEDETGQFLKTVEFAVIDNYKGKLSDTLELRFKENCDFEVIEGESYLIFGTMTKDFVVSDRCTRSKDIIDASDDIEVLKGKEKRKK